ncbi:MAG: hypothetical protein QOE35_863 [Actinomycetota bacterium]
MSPTELRRKAEQTDWLEWAGRAGLATRGLLYLSVGMVAAQIAFGDTREEADRAGALHAVARQPFGHVLIAVLAVGMAAYAIWQVVLAVIGPNDEGDDASAAAKRAASIGRAAIYLAGVATALPLAVGRAEGSGNKEQDWTAKALHLPGGRWLVGAIGVAIIGAGLWNGWKGVSGEWRKKLETSEMTRDEKKWAEPIAVAGLVGRMLVFGLVGGFLVRAAVRYDPHKGVGLDAALKEVRGKAYGPWALLVFALALMLFGVFSLLQARWRNVEG